MRRLRISENKWKYFSFILIAVIAVGITAPRSFADSTSSILYIVTNIQKTLLPNLQTTVDSIKTATTDNLDAKVSSRADGSLYNSARASKLDNLDNLDAKMSDVKAKTDLIPSTPPNGVTKSIAIDKSVAPGDGKSVLIPLTPSQANTLFSGTATITYITQ